MNLTERLSNSKHVKRLFALAVVCAFLLVLPSCGIPRLRRPISAPPVPENIHGDASPENSAQVRVEEFFDDPLLSELIHEALEGNQELRLLYEDIQIVGNEVLARSGAYLPFAFSADTAGMEKLSRFTPLGAAERNLDFLPGKGFPEPTLNFLVAANISWEVDIWRRLRNLRDSAILRFFASTEGRNFFVTRMVAEVAENYYRLIALDARMENLDRIIALQQRSYEIARLRKQQARGTDLPVQRFLAEVRKNQGEKLVVTQDIIQTENRINFLLGRFPQRIERRTGKFVDMPVRTPNVGLPAQLFENRPDIRQAERELAATGLDVKAARARFYPTLALSGPIGPAGPWSPVGWQAFNPRYLFVTPDAFIANIAGDLITPWVNKRAIRADYQTANAKQLQAVYNYQRVVINAFNEVYNRITRVENFGRSVEIRKQQVQALEAAVEAATSLYNLPRAELPIDYLDVLTAQNELFVAIRDLIELKGEQFFAVVNTYQALGGGGYLLPTPSLREIRAHPWTRWWRRRAARESKPGPPPPAQPTPPASESGPGAIPTPPPGSLGLFSPPPMEGAPVPPSTPPAASNPVPPATPPADGDAPARTPPATPPAAGGLPDPLPAPGEAGAGAGAGAGMNEPPR